MFAKFNTIKKSRITNPANRCFWSGLLAVVLLCGFTQFGNAQVTVTDGPYEVTAGFELSPWTTATSFSIAAAADRLLVATINTTGGDITGLSYNGNAMTEAVSHNDAAVHADIYYLVLPGSGALNGTFTATSSAAFFISATISAIVVTGADVGGTPLGNTVVSLPTDCSAASVSMATVSGSLVVDLLATGGGGPNWTVGPLQTVMAATNGQPHASSHETSTGGTTTMSWNCTGTTSLNAHVAAEFLEPGAAPCDLTITQCPPNFTEVSCDLSDITPTSALPFSAGASNITAAEFGTEGGTFTTSNNITTITYQDVVAGNCPKTVTRTFTLNDDCPDVATCNQTITLDDPANHTTITTTGDVCVGNETFDQTGVTVNGKPEYQDLNSGLHFMRWSGARWEIQNAGGDILHINNTDTPTPPCSANFAWSLGPQGGACGTITVAGPDCSSTAPPVCDLVIACPADFTVVSCDLADITPTSSLPFSAGVTATTEAVFTTTEGGTITTTNNVTSVTYQDASVGNCPKTVSRMFTVVDDCPVTKHCTQTITLSDPSMHTTITTSGDVCVGSQTFDQTGVMVNGKPEYQAQGGASHLYIRWSGTQWEIIDGNNGNVFHVNTEDTPTPPCSTDFPWSLGPNGAGCGIITVAGPACSKAIFINCPTDPPAIEWPTGFNTTPVPQNTPQDPSIDTLFYGVPTGDVNPFSVGDWSWQDVIAGPTPGLCPNLWVVTRTFTGINNVDGQAFTCVQTFTFTDTTPPTILCPPPLTFEWPVGFNLNPVPPNVPQDPSIDPGITGNPITDDNCGVANVTYQDILIGPTPGNCPFLWTVERIWIVTDFCGLTATCVQVFTFTDTTPPTIICPPPLTLEWPPNFNLNPVPPNVPQDPSIDPGITGNPIADDNCGVANVTYQDILIGPTPGNCPFLWTVERTWIVTDFCGLTASCVQIFTFTDTTPPTILCPPPLTFEWPAGFNLNPVPPNVPQDPSIDPGITGNPIADDNCGVANVTYQDILIGPTPGNCPFLWTVERTWIVTDFCGLTASCVQIFTFTDTTPPTILCPPPLTLEWPAGFNLNPVPPNVPQDPSIDPGITGNPIADDNCGVANVTYQDVLIGPTPGNCPFLWTVERTWIVTDFCGLTASCVQIFTFTDTTPPTILCPPPLTFEWPAGFNLNPVPPNVPQDPSIDPGITGNPIADDNCGVANVTYQDVLIGPTPGNCPFLWTVERTWIVTDFCGLTASCVQIFTFTDTTPPTILCPPPLTFEWPAGFNLNPVPPNVPQDPSIDPGITGNPIADDNCGVANVTYQDILIGPTPGDCPFLWTVERTWIVTDFCGLTASCVQIFTFTDTTPPTILCPPPLTFEWPAGFNLNPVPPNVPQDPSIDPGITGNPITDDNCGVANVTYQDILIGPTPGNCPFLWTVERTWIVTDFCGLTASCVQTFTFTDTTDPVIISCPASPAVIEWPAGFNTAPVGANTPQDPSIDPATYGTALATDNCGVPLVTYQDVIAGPTPANCPNLWVVTRTWTATDACGLTHTCVQTFTFSDTTNPNPSCTNISVALNTPPGTYTFTQADIDAIGAGSTDNCGTPTLTLNETMVDCSDGSSIGVVLTATDACGNNADCNATVTITDPSAYCCALVVTCPSPPLGTIDCDDPIPTAATNEAEFEALGGVPDIASGFCGTLIIFHNDVFTPPTNICNGRTMVRTYTVKDDNTTVTCSQTLMINAPAMPTINCPADPAPIEWIPTFNLNPVGQNTPQDPSIDPSIYGSPTTTVSCSGTTVTYQDVLTGPTPANCPELWIVERTWTVTDDCGETDVCVQTFTFTDTTPPTVVTCPTSPAPIEWPAGFNTTPVGPNTPQDPSINPSNYNNIVYSDNCGVVSVDYQDVIVGPTPGNCPILWVVTRTWTITDVCGLTDQCDQVFTYTDTTDPVFTFCPPSPASIEWPAGFNTNPAPPNTPQDPSIDPAVYGIPIATDNCGVPVVTYQDVIVGPTPANCPNLWVVTRTWTATDNCGLTTTCVQTFEYTDTTPPVIVNCPPPLNYEGCSTADIAANGHLPFSNGAVIGVSKNDFTNEGGVASDNCGIFAYQYQDVANGTCPIVVTRIWTIIDFCGLVDVCTQVISIDDTTAPNVACQNISVSLTANGDLTITPAQVFNAAGSNDNCGQPLTLVSVLPNTFTCQNEGLNNVVLIAEDNCGNQGQCPATVTIGEFITNIMVTPSPESCAGAGDGQILASATAGGGQLKYSIDGGANYQLSGLFTNLTPGNYTVVIKVFGIPAVCEETATVTIAAGPAPQICYADIDNDGYGAANIPPVTACNCPTGYKTAAQLGGNTNNDCNDSNAAINPGAAEICDGLDNNCDGVVPANEIDADGDGFRLCDGDCNDGNAAVNPGATEVCNGIDDDCDGLIDEGTSGGLTYNGNVAFFTQAQVDAWSACYSVINGNVTILGAGVNNLGPLGNIVQITGNLLFQSTGLTSMAGLNSLTTVGGTVTIYFNSSLTTLNGLNALATVGGSFFMYYNFQLSDCCAVKTLLNGGVSGAVVVFFNKVGCNSLPEINATCAPPPPLVGPNQSNGNQTAFCPDCEEVNGFAISVYPNPVSSTLTVSIVSNELKGTIQMTDVAGRLIATQHLVEGQSNYKLDVSFFKGGLYFIHVKVDGKKQVVKRVIVEKAD